MIIIITPTSSPRAMMSPSGRSGTPGGAVAANGAKSSSPSTWNKAASLCAAASALFALEDVQSGVGSTERAGPRLGITDMH